MPNETLPADTADVPVTEFFGAIYRFFYNKLVGLIIILAMALLTFFGVLFPQAPDSVIADKATLWEPFLDSLRPRFGGLTEGLSALGMFSVFSSWPFRIVVILLALSIIACTTHRIPVLWRQAMNPHTHVGPAFFDKARLHETVTVSGKTSEASECVAQVLGKRRFRIIADEETKSFYADRNRWAPMGTAVAHTAFVVILLGVLVSSLTGFRDEGVAVPIGGATEVGHGTGLVVSAESFTDEYYDDGRPKDYSSTVVVRRGNDEVAKHVIRVNSPLRVGDVAFNQQSFGVAAEIHLADQSGNVFDKRIVPLDRSTRDEVNIYGTYAIPDRKIEVYVVGVAPGKQDSQLKPGQMLLEVYENGSKTPAGSKVLSPGTPTTIGAQQVVFVRERAFTSLQIARDPGRPIVWVGSGLLILGMCLTMFLRHHRIWGTYEVSGDETTVKIASPDRADMSFAHEFQAIASELSTSKNG